MEKTYDHKIAEKRIYKMWEDGGYFKAERDPAKKPYTIILPPPNASGKMHTGNVLMIAIEDLLIRWKRMQGYSALWIPGTDHAGTETQITFEKELKKQGKSRFSYTREGLYQAIWDFVQTNKGNIELQMREMGASVDWSRSAFTLDPHVVKTVHDTFKRMVGDGLVYRGNYMVNYCPKCGTTYSDVELKHEERIDALYYMKYGPFTLATVRPETKFGDTAVAVHPDDARYNDWIGKEIEVAGLLGSFKLKVIGDRYVNPEFGTGVVKVTPAHDKNDYEAGKRHNLEIKPVINLEGKLNELAGKYAGLSVFEARKIIVTDLKERGLIEKVDDKYLHTVALCKAGHDIEPMVIPNWFIKVDDIKKSFKKPALEAVKNGDVKIYPQWREITYIRWMEEMYDWPISRQNVWGIQIPIWYELNEPKDFYVWFIDRSGIFKHGNLEDFLAKGTALPEVLAGLQRVLASENSPWVLEEDKQAGKEYLPETDTFDTWFSSGQWPLVTLGYPSSEDFNYFYPNAVLETGWEIIRLWVSRMIMFGIYLTGKPPFRDVYLHGMVRAIDGRKMSKSLGNVVNPDDYLEKFGADALRMGLVSGTANGKDFSFPHDKVVGYRNFANKIWNMARFMLMMFEQENIKTCADLISHNDFSRENLTAEDRKMLKVLEATVKNVDISLENYRFADAAEEIYHFMWDALASVYIESIKSREDKRIALSVLYYIYTECLKLLHPFMPFVTEEIWTNLPKKDAMPLITSEWPS